MFNPSHDVIIRKYVHKGDVVIDAGANRGDYCRKFLNRGAIVHAFEPGTVFRELYTRLHSEPNINFHPVALGEFGIATLNEYAGTGQSTTTFVRNDGAGELIYSHQVPCHQIDDFNFAPAFIKIDCEGADFEILRGAEHTIRLHHPVVIVENNIPLLSQRNQSLSDMTDFMLGLGYRYELIGGGLAGDVLFTPIKDDGEHPESYPPINAGEK